MATWTDEDLYRLDEQFAKKGVARHARAFHAAIAILGSEFAIGVGGNPQVDAITADYDRLFPDAGDTWPGMGIGLAASVDQVRKVTVPVVYGTCEVVVSKGIGFEIHEEFARWCRGNADIATRAAFAFADLFDLTYGLNEVDNAKPEAVESWRLAMSQLEMTTSTLIGSFDLSALTQSICMTVELSLKAALMHLGVDATALKKLGHDNVKSAELLASKKPHRDDALIATLVAKLPPYVGSRYKRADLTRLKMIDLALASQFIASSTLRRLTTRDFAANIEREEGANARTRLCA
ncbi:MAG: hypothetical protein COA41_00450 [Sphingopyxis sp.]|nr:MAG: hypothetical protein COA41_00450 [Sphingopyxis sp.]